MTGSDRAKWNRKYQDADLPKDLRPPHWLEEHIESLPVAPALDLATGLGHAAIRLAQYGCAVTAIDISINGLELAARFGRQFNAGVSWVAGDVKQFPIRPESMAVITCFSFLLRGGFSETVIQTLEPGGTLIYETFTTRQLEMPGNHIRNRDFLLEPGELKRLFDKLELVDYRETVVEGRAVASLVARKPDKAMAS